MVKNIKYFIFLSLFTMLLPSCKKLNSSTIYVSTFCKECGEIIQSSIEEIAGIQYVYVDTASFSITYHFEARDADKQVENWLIQNGLVLESTNTNDTLFRVLNILDCCNPD